MWIHLTARGGAVVVNMRHVTHVRLPDGPYGAALVNFPDREEFLVIEDQDSCRRLEVALASLMGEAGDPFSEPDYAAAAELVAAAVDPAADRAARELYGGWAE